MADLPREVIVPRQGIRATCEQGHRQDIFTPDMGKAEAEQYAGLLDGTSPLFKYPLRAYPDVARDAGMPGPHIGRCGLCGAWLNCVLFGYEGHNRAGGD